MNGLNNLKRNKMEDKETLEEVAKSYSERHQDVSGTLGRYLVGAVFQDGAKWQQERSYSEEEVIDFLQEMNDWPTTFEGRIDIREWFKQFKNK
jgi:hypothetical protein